MIIKAKISGETSNNKPSDHFVDVNKMVVLGSNSQREIPDIMRTKYACYLIAQSGDPRKETIAFTQTYFAMQTRKLELIQEQIHGLERSQARQKQNSEKAKLEIFFCTNHQCSMLLSFSYKPSNSDIVKFFHTNNQFYSSKAQSYSHLQT